MDGSCMEHPAILTGCDVTEDPGMLDNDDDLESEENQNTRKTKIKSRYKFLEFNPDIDMENFQFSIDLCFLNMGSFRTTIRQYSIKERRRIKFKKRDVKKISAECKGTSSDGQQCQWYIYGAKMGNEQTIHIRRNSTWPVSSMQELVRKEKKVEVSFKMLYRVKKMALSIVTGTEKEQYASLWKYCEQLRRSNPGTTTKVKWQLTSNGEPQFRRIYICLGPLKK
ncbi:hypothetical protein LIER_13195 [Lithospermum erythrorhizon]|uniref:Transposase MuDR plant domain-containing protein n=1 Tax=Lithospermum erythrorhizon TaxID=34254 RepID=A0AAV3PUL0_LITER